MKKSIIIALAALMMVAVSCKKNVVENTNSPNPIVQTSDAVTRIVKFKKQVEYYRENPNLRDGIKISLSEAVWDIENTFDATYSYTEDSYGETKDHEFTLYLNVDNEGDVLLSDLTVLYDQMTDAARDAYANDGFEDKIFISLTAKVIDVNGGVASIKIKAKTGERTNYNIPTCSEEGPFNVGDDYKYDFGTCEDPDNGYGAAYLIQQNLRSLIRSDIEEPEAGCRNIYVNRFSVDFIGNDPRFTGLFYRTDIDDYCIAWPSMNHHYNAEKRAIFVTIPNDPAFHGGSITNVTIYGATDNVDYITHRTVAEYAKRVSANVSDVGEIEDLLK